MFHGHPAAWSYLRAVLAPDATVLGQGGNNEAPSLLHTITPLYASLGTASRNHNHFGHESWDHQLKLAVAWNRVDIARSEIFTDDHEWKVRGAGRETRTLLQEHFLRFQNAGPSLEGN